MAGFRCRCGNDLSNISIPNDVKLWMYTDKEWSEILGMKISEMEDLLDIPDPQIDAWQCPKCERIYFFEGNRVKKVFALETDWKTDKWDKVSIGD